MATATSRRRIAGDRTRQRREEQGVEGEVGAPAEPMTVLDLDALDAETAPAKPGPVTPAPAKPASATPAPAEPTLAKPTLAKPAQPEVLTDAAPVEVAASETVPTGVSNAWRSRQGVVVAALAVSLVAVLVACTLALITTRRDRSDIAAGSVALSAAKKDAATILSYDYRHLPQDYAAAAALTTGSFRTDYQATTSKAVTPLATQTHAVVTAKVATGGVVSSTSTRATVLLFVDQTTTSNRLDAPKVDLNRVQLTLQKVGGRWLVSGLKAL